MPAATTALTDANSPRSIIALAKAWCSSMKETADLTVMPPRYRAVIPSSTPGVGSQESPPASRCVDLRHRPKPRCLGSGEPEQGGSPTSTASLPSERAPAPEPRRERQRPHPLGDAANGGGTPCHAPNHPFNLHQNTPCEFDKSPSARCSAAPDGATSWCHARRNRGRRDPYPCPGAVKRHLFSRRPHHGLLASGSFSSL